MLPCGRILTPRTQITIKSRIEFVPDGRRERRCVLAEAVGFEPTVEFPPR